MVENLCDGLNLESRCSMEKSFLKELHRITGVRLKLCQISKYQSEYMGDQTDETTKRNNKENTSN